PGAFMGLHLLLPVQGELDAALKERVGHPAVDLYGRPAIGAQARLQLPDGRKLVAQVDGGTGHSGRRSPDIHLGLGKIAAATKLDVELNWRSANGTPEHTTLKLTPGWHTILLGQPQGTAIAVTDPRTQ
ncbi:MAG TPA: ASPIC/UnbV domain-containing protein, partial [Candidatus Dormibacteraeota bacterium]|nr:ASPIC/UnbV domain-containing protein [Candidatus Dormibacteraeota bacterium]